ncbi:UDP-glucose 4-epimerase [termite gut metagenome]|uniref:UDP-glucose 4-epimerase n=1 Tax=termite gut metagenome TaxID=433724 RepID=A0A5J4PWU1_9ZZZZ
MNILVTGGAGFIGSHLCDLLLEKKNRVVVIDNLILGKIENISHLLNRDNFTFIEEDLLDKNILQKIFNDESFDMVYHLAANSDIQKVSYDPTVDYNYTFNTTFNILQCMCAFNVKKLFFSSTSAIYGETYAFLS